MSVAPKPWYSLYYRAPEGEDILGKLAFSSKYMGMIGLSLGIVEAQIATQSKGLWSSIGKISYFTFPFLGMGAAFVTTVYISTNLRKKDDNWNYALGGAITGTVVGAWKRSAGVGALSAIALGVAAVIQKEAWNGTAFPYEKPYKFAMAYQGLGTKNSDFTLYKELPGNWTTEKK